jgi:hypothetical protein
VFVVVKVNEPRTRDLGEAACGFVVRFPLELQRAHEVGGLLQRYPTLNVFEEPLRITDDVTE